YTVGALSQGAGARHADRQEGRRRAHPLRVPGGHRPDGVRRAIGKGYREPSLTRAGVGAGGAGRIAVMWIMGRGVVTALVATMLVAGSAWADNNPNGAAFRAVGWFRGNEEITADQIKCEVPTVSSAISDGLYA